MRAARISVHRNAVNRPDAGLGEGIRERVMMQSNHRPGGRQPRSRRGSVSAFQLSTDRRLPWRRGLRATVGKLAFKVPTKKIRTKEMKAVRGESHVDLADVKKR